MTINSTLGRRVATATGGQTAFTFSFSISDESDISVYHRAAADDPSPSDLLTLNTDYTVTINGSSGGTVTLVDAAANGDIVVIQLTRDLERTSDYTTLTSYTADNLNTDLDNSIQSAKRNAATLAVTPSYNYSSALTDADLYLPVLGDGQSWRMASDGSEIVAYTTPEDDPGAAALRSDLAAATGATLVGTATYADVQTALDALDERAAIYAIDTGAANALVVTLTPAPTAYNTGEVLIVKAAAANTGATTINKNALGVKSITDYTGAALTAGAIAVSQLLILVYDGTKYIYVNNVSASATAYPLGYQYGLEISNSVGDDIHDITLSTGRCRDAGDSYNILSASTITKRIDANWAAGDAQGGFPSGLVLTGGTWYRFFVLSKTDGTIDAGFDTSATAANLIADATAYTKYRQRGWIYYNASNEIEQFLQDGDWFFLVDQEAFLVASAAGNYSVTAGPIALDLPDLDLKYTLRGNIICSSGTNRNTGRLFRSYEDNTIAVPPDGWTMCYNTTNFDGYSAHESTGKAGTGTVYIRTANTQTVTAYVRLISWIDPRL
jgi:hypothetical protein